MSDLQLLNCESEAERMIGRDMQYTMYYTSDLSQGSTMITVSFTSGGVYLLLLDTLFFKVIFKN